MHIVVPSLGKHTTYLAPTVLQYSHIYKHDDISRENLDKTPISDVADDGKHLDRIKTPFLIEKYLNF